MINLHAITRGAINALHPDEPVLIVRAKGQRNDKGVITPEYDVYQATAQVQSLSDEKLYQANQVGQNDIQKTFYLYSDGEASNRPSGVWRPLARSGDLIRRKDLTWWLITTVKEDFSASGWVNVGATLQVKDPVGWKGYQGAYPILSPKGPNQC